MLGTWVGQFVREACDRAGDGLELAEGEDDAVFPDLGRGGGSPRVLMVKALSERLMELVATGAVRVVAVLDDPVDSVRFTKAQLGVDMLHAMREQTRVAVANHLYRDNTGVALIQRGFQGSARSVAALLADNLPLVLDQAVRGLVIEQFGGPADEDWTIERALEARVAHYATLASLREVIGADEATIVRQVLSPLVLGAISADIGPITWSSKVFLFGDRPNEVAPAVADVTGAARILYYGPYFHLPPGDWKARFLIAFSPEIRGTPFRLIVYCGGDAIAKVLLRPSEGGAFEGLFTMRHTTPARSIEIHFMNDEGTIEGQVAFGQMIFSRV